MANFFHTVNAGVALAAVRKALGGEEASRYVSVGILYDGADVGLTTRLESLSYTDNSSGTSDELSLTFGDTDGDWLGGFTPEKEHDLDATLYFNNWTKGGECLPYHCGNFTLDDLSYSGTPRTITIKGVSIPAAEGFTAEKHSKTWEKITIKQLGQEFKDRYGMGNLYYWGAEPVLETVTQDKQTDSEFLADICKKNGMLLKVYKNAFVIFDKAVYETWEPVAKFTESDFESYEWNSTLRGTYTGATLSYTSSKKKKEKTISVTVGEGPRFLRVNESAEEEGEAIRLAKAKLNEENEKAVTMSFSIPGNVKIMATTNIAIYGMGRMDGKYFVDKVTHNLTGSGGYKMKVSCYKIFNRL